MKKYNLEHCILLDLVNWYKESENLDWIIGHILPWHPVSLLDAGYVKQTATGEYMPTEAGIQYAQGLDIRKDLWEGIITRLNARQ